MKKDPKHMRHKEKQLGGVFSLFLVERIFEEFLRVTFVIFSSTGVAPSLFRNSRISFLDTRRSRSCSDKPESSTLVILAPLGIFGVGRVIRSFVFCFGVVGVGFRTFDVGFSFLICLDIEDFLKFASRLFLLFSVVGITTCLSWIETWAIFNGSQ